MRHHKAELKVKALQQTVSEVMSLDHAEFTHRFLTDSKLNATQTTPTTI